jgi:RND family efflux transporter MFP subunit
MMRKFVIPGLVILGSVFGGVTLMATSPELEPDVPEPVPTTVRVQVVEPRAIKLSVHSQGTVSPNTESQLIPEVSGRVQYMSPSLVNGGHFQAGDVLLRLEDQDSRSANQRAAAALARAEAEYEHARFEYQRIESLEARQLVSRSQMENMLRAYRVSEAALQDARANVEVAKRDMERTAITAPFTGLVRDERVDIGQFVSRGTAIATLYASDQSEVRLPIADRQLAFLNLPVGTLGELPAQEQPNVTLRADYAGQQMVWHGTIVRTEAQIDTASRMVNVVARVTNRDQSAPLSVGLFVNAEIEGLTVDDIVVLPRSALREGNRVLIVDGENRRRCRNIEPLRLYHDDVLIKAGLEPGERVCLSPLQTPIDGMTVNPVADGQLAAS